MAGICSGDAAPNPARRTSVRIWGGDDRSRNRTVVTVVMAGTLLVRSTGCSEKSFAALCIDRGLAYSAYRESGGLSTQWISPPPLALDDRNVVGENRQRNVFDS